MLGKRAENHLPRAFRTSQAVYAHKSPWKSALQIYAIALSVHLVKDTSDLSECLQALFASLLLVMLHLPTATSHKKDQPTNQPIPRDSHICYRPTSETKSRALGVWIPPFHRPPTHIWRLEYLVTSHSSDVTAKLRCHRALFVTSCGIESTVSRVCERARVCFCIRVYASLSLSLSRERERENLPFMQ